MKQKALTLAGAVLAGSMLTAFSAHALPVSVGFSLTAAPNPAVPIGLTVLGSGDGSAAVEGFTFGAFNISISATGTPPFTAPNFGSNTLTVSSNSAGSITLYAIESGITARPTTITSGFSNNPLSNTTVTESTFVGPSTALLTNPLATATLAPGGTTSAVTPFPGGAPATYSTTETFSITFGANGGTVNATILDVAQFPPVSTPEPVSLSLLGVGLVGIGVLRRKRKAS